MVVNQKNILDFANKTKDDEGNIDIGSNKGTKLIKAWKAEGYILSGGSHGITSKEYIWKKIRWENKRQVYIIDFPRL